MSTCQRCDVPLEPFEKFHCDVCEHYTNCQNERIAEKILQSKEMESLIFGEHLESGAIRFLDGITPIQQFNQFDWSK
tara:strand:- start:1433 stop:1663 length:231 start_codon:yes stop_codon:yes gene_type:complete